MGELRFVSGLFTRYGYIMSFLRMEKLIQLPGDLRHSRLEAVLKICLVVAGSGLVAVVQAESLDEIGREELCLSCG